MRKEEEEEYDREAGNWSAFVWVFSSFVVFLIGLQYNKDLEFGFGFKFLKIGLVLNI